MMRYSKTLLLTVSLLLLVAGTLCSCSKNELIQTSEINEITDELSAQKEFAKILSKAVGQDSNLREYLKQEALRCYDNDYDVFYPWIKDTEISEGITFKDILLKYCDDPKLLEDIETTIPKLTILIQDWSWIDSRCFSVKTWNTTSDEVAVGISDGSSKHLLFADGKAAGTIEEGEIPGFPVLIVKSNERMKVVSPATRGGCIQYAFVDDAFDGSLGTIETKAQTNTVNWDYDTSGESVFEEAQKIDSKVVAAYEEFKDTPNAAQRDYIYYGLTKEKPIDGDYKSSVKEYLYRFRINPAVISTIFDSKPKDPEFVDTYSVKRDKNRLKPDKNEIQSHLWAGGALEIVIQVFLGNGMPNSMETFSKNLTIYPSALWEAKKSTEKRTTDVLLRHHYTYTTRKEDLARKWYYPYSLSLPYWNLAENSGNIWIRVYEYDETATEDDVVQHGYKYASNFKTNTSASGEIKKIKATLGFDYTYSDERNGTSSITIKKTTGRDFLGDVDLSYMDKIIESGPVYFEGKRGYNLGVCSTGDVELTFIPR